MKIIRIIILLSLLLLLLIPLAGNIQAQGLTKFEYYDSGNDANTTLMGLTWAAQTFTTTSTFTFEEARLMLYREGAPGNVEVELKAVDGSGHPTGSALSTGTLNGNALTTETTGAWYAVDMTSYDLEYNTQYALVAHCDYGYSNNTVRWHYDSGGATYAGGEKLVSANSGITWAAGAGEDYMFEVWGITDIYLHNVKIWRDYREADDWLITAYYTCTVNPYYDNNEPPERWFNLQLLDGNCTSGTVIAQSPVRFWGHAPASIYLSAEEQEDIEWGGNYTIRLYSNLTGTCDVAGNLTAADWRGVNLNELDSWCLQVAHSIEDIYGVDLTIGIAGSGEVLNTVGGPIFRTGIPQLMDIRNIKLFQESVESYDRPASDFENKMQEETDMEARLGAYTYGAIEEAADAMGIEIYILGFIGIALIYFILASRGVPMGHTGAGMILSISSLYIGLYTGTFLWIWFSLIAIISAGLFIWHTWLRQT